MKYIVNDGMKITIRKSSLVQAGDYVTELGSGVVFDADTVNKTENTHWVRVTKCDLNPKAVGFFGAVMYPNSIGLGKVFATVIDSEPPPPETTPQFPTSFILENPADGSRALYEFVKVIE